MLRIQFNKGYLLHHLLIADYKPSVMLTGQEVCKIVDLPVALPSILGQI